MENPATISFKRRNLPHWKVVGHPYFVTFRLKNTLPKEIVKEFKIEREKLKSSKADKNIISDYERKIFRKIESILDNLNNDSCYLKNPEIADLVMNSFVFIEQKYKWKFPCIVVMPNHVHCLAANQNKATISLEKALGYLKSYTAKEANKIMKLTGSFWSPENFDHWCRTPEQEIKVREYIRNNPVKAGLVSKPEDWKWLRIVQ